MLKSQTSVAGALDSAAPPFFEDVCEGKWAGDLAYRGSGSQLRDSAGLTPASQLLLNEQPPICNVNERGHIV